MANVNADVMWDLVSALKNMLGSEASDGTEQALVTRVERDGTVYVRLLGADSETPVNGERLSDVEAGDVVTVSVANGLLSIIGNSTRPSTNAEHVSQVVEPVAQRADNAANRASEANDRAIDAGKVANATAQHVWADDIGLHVTEVEQTEWNDPTSERYRSGMNVLLNVLGQLFRNGLNNMLALISGTDPAIEIYDGEGNEEENVVAGFRKDEITLCGGAGRISVGPSGGIDFIGADSDGTTSAGVGTAIINNTLGAQMFAQSGDFDSFAEIQIWPAIDMLYDVPTMHVAVNSDDYDFALSDFVNAIPVTLFNNDSASASATTTLSETSANFRRLTIFFKDTDNNCSSVEVWNPNGKRVALDLTWINGASTQEMYQRVRWVTINGTSITTAQNSGDPKARVGQIKLGATASVENNDYIAITHVIGYR